MFGTAHIYKYMTTNQTGTAQISKTRATSGKRTWP